MRTRLPSTCLLLFLLAWPIVLPAQTDEPSLGDLARTLRKNKATQQPEKPVIDNDNFSQALQDVKKVKPSEDRLVFSVDKSGKAFKVSSEDVTCSLSFNARAASLLIKPVILEDVPISELLKLDGPASIQDDNLQLEVFNGTEWELREITVGLTLERKAGENAELAARVIPAAQGFIPPVVERHSDVTVLYHLKGTAKPFTTTAFKENIGVTPAPDQEWRWSIVEAKGLRPDNSQLPPEPQVPPEPLPNSAPLPLPNVAPPAAATTNRTPNSPE